MPHTRLVNEPKPKGVTGYKGLEPFSPLTISSLSYRQPVHRSLLLSTSLPNSVLSDRREIVRGAPSLRHSAWCTPEGYPGVICSIELGPRTGQRV
ncbi:hypothetical protein M378DRAFT_154892, partial [Amanita muscaria Koide BX008]